MVNNRRHAKLTLWFLCQNYKSIPLSVRTKITDLFLIGKINKNELENIFDEQIEINKNKFDEILKIVFRYPHDFIYIYINNQNNKIFSNWNELLI